VEGKVAGFPVTSEQLVQNRIGPRGVSCQVSMRWLVFGEESDLLEGGEFMGVDVMTLDQYEKPRRLCHLIVTREDLLRALSHVRPKA
jgi:hypothetical protein